MSTGEQPAAIEDLKRVWMFEDLAAEYCDVARELGVLEAIAPLNRKLNRHERVTLYVLSMLERKFITRKDSTHLPTVIDALDRLLAGRGEHVKDVLNLAKTEYRKAYCGDRSGLEFHWNSQKLDYRDAWRNLVYGRLLHADEARYDALQEISSDFFLRARWDDSHELLEIISKTLATVKEARQCGWLPERPKQAWDDVCPEA